MINQRLFRGVDPNGSDASRALIAVSYRPAWAGPTSPLPEPEAEQLDRLPKDLRPYLSRPNCGLSDTTIVNWREDLPAGGDGLGRAAGRWVTR